VSDIKLWQRPCRQAIVAIFPIRNIWKQGDVLTPLLFKFVLDYTIRRVQINQDGLKLNITGKKRGIVTKSF